MRKRVLVKCPDCGVERLVILRPTTANGISRCPSCNGTRRCSLGMPHGQGSQNPHWKGGRQIDSRYGHIKRWVDSSNPYFAMATHMNNGTGIIPEHRLVMAEHLGRCLTRQEHVHHLNGDKADNRLENLRLISPTDHILYDRMCAHCNLRKQIRLLKEHIKVLKSQQTLMI